MFFNYFRDFEDGATISALGYDIIIRRRSIGTLLLTSGKLVACDPLTSLDSESFFQRFAPGNYPVHMFIAELRDEERAAYAMIKITDGEAVRWEIANVHEPEEGVRGLLGKDEEEGYSVDSSIGCFMDADTALTLIDYKQIVMPEEDELEKVVRAQVRKRRKRGPGYAAIELGRDLNLAYNGSQNLVAFDTGYGPGVYPTYIGRDADNQIVSVVTDFLVLDFRFPSFSFRGK